MQGSSGSAPLQINSRDLSRSEWAAGCFSKASILWSQSPHSLPSIHSAPSWRASLFVEPTNLCVCRVSLVLVRMPMDRNLLRFHQSSKLLVLLLLPRIEANPYRRAAIKSPVGIAVNTFQSRTLCGGCLLVLPACLSWPTYLSGCREIFIKHSACRALYRLYLFTICCVCGTHFMGAKLTRATTRRTH